MSPWIASLIAPRSDGIASATPTPIRMPATVTATPVQVPPPGGPRCTIVRLEAHRHRDPKEGRWRSRSPIFPTTTTRSSRTSTSRRCASITTSTTRPMWTRRTPPSRAPSGPTRTSTRSSRTSPAWATRRPPSATTPAATPTTRFFWEIMSPDGGGEPDGDLASAINDKFGDFDSFKEEFKNAGVNQFGSGWAWLIHDGSGLAVVSTAEPELADLRRSDADHRLRRLGARLLPEVPEQAPGLHRRLVERRQLGEGGRALLGPAQLRQPRSAGSARASGSRGGSPGVRPFGSAPAPSRARRAR